MASQHSISRLQPLNDIQLQSMSPIGKPEPARPRTTEWQNPSGHASTGEVLYPQPSNELSQDILSASPNLSKAKALTVIIVLSGTSFLNTMGSGVLIGALPQIAIDLQLSEGFLLWPASVYALSAGCLLLIFGAVADVVGAKNIWVTGCFFYMVFTVAVGLSQTGVQIILFRVFAGAAIAMCLPTAVSLLTNTFPRGSWRNAAFAANGVGQPVGFSVGLLLGGILTDTIEWRWSFYIIAIFNFLILIAAIPVLPKVQRVSDKKWTRRLIEDIDWIGACIMSVAAGILLYVLATTTASYRHIGQPSSIGLLVASLVLLGSFPVWMNYQTSRGKPAIIPNKLWRNAAFTTTCVAVFFCWSAFNAIEYFAML